LKKLLYRRSEAAEVLSFSLSQIMKFEKQGMLTPIWPVPGLRSVRYAAEEVEALAEKWIAEGSARRDQ
jgi:hypothetical protein